MLIRQPDRASLFELGTRGIRLVSAALADIEIGERDERADVFVGVAQRLTRELYPGVSEELTARSANANSYHGSADSPLGQHA